MVGGENRHNDARSAIVEKNEILIHKSFYMAGQWVEPGGGIPGVAASGRNVIQLICKQDKKSFRSD